MDDLTLEATFEQTFASDRHNNSLHRTYHQLLLPKLFWKTHLVRPQSQETYILRKLITLIQSFARSATVKVQLT